MENVIIYPRLGIGSPKHLQHKITEIANMWEEMEVFVKTWEGSASISQSVAIVTVKTCKIALH